MVGESSLPDGTYHAFFYTGGKMRDLGTLGAYGVAYGINNQSEVVGEYNGQAFIYSSGKIQMLGTLGGKFQNFSYAECINNSGEVVGTSTIAGLPSDEHLANHAFLLASVTSINDAGQIVAWVNADGGRLFLLTGVHPGIRP